MRRQPLSHLFHRRAPQGSRLVEENGFTYGSPLGRGGSSGRAARRLTVLPPRSGAPPGTVHPATLARGPGRPASLYLARSKSISSSNPDLAVAPSCVDDEVSRILASKVGRGGPWSLGLSAVAARWVGEGPQRWWRTGNSRRDMDTGWTLGSRGAVAVTGQELGLGFALAPCSGADLRLGGWGLAWW